MMWERVNGGALCALLNLGILCASAGATTLNPSDSQWKTNGSVATTPKYSTALPAYFTLANVVSTLDSPLTGFISGHIVTTVYRSPGGTLSFDYQIFRDPAGSANIVQALFGGSGWAGIAISNAGANALGASGTGDPTPEWGDGDPLYIARDPATQSPNLQWRFSGLGTVIGPGNKSSEIFFETNARGSETASGSAIGSNSATSWAYILTPTVPEPAGLLLALGSGILLLVGRIRRRA